MRLPWSKAPAPVYPVVTTLNLAPVAVSPVSSAAAPRRASPGNPPKSTNRPRRSYWEALSTNGERGSLPLGLGSTLNHWLSDMSRDQLVGLSRYLVDNNPLAAYAVGLKARYSAPITVSAATISAEWNTQADLWWKDWQTRSDFTGRFHFETLQKIFSQTLDTDADLGLIVTTQAGFPQLQTVDGMAIRSDDRTDPLIANGVQLDEFGRVVGYHVRGIDGVIPEPEMLLAYHPRNLNEYRGIPVLSATGGNDLRDSHEIKSAQKGKQKAHSSLVMAVKGGDGTLEPNKWGDDNGNAPAADASASVKQTGVFDMIGREVITLPESMEFVAPGIEVKTADYIQFQDHLAGAFLMAVGIPPAFGLDEKLTGPNQRAVNDKFSRTVAEQKAMLTRIAVWVRTRVIAWAIANDELPFQVGWDKVATQGPAEISIDMGQQMHDREATKSGNMTLQEYCGRKNQNWERVVNQNFIEAGKIIEGCEKLAKGDPTKLSLLLARYLPAQSQIPVTPLQNENPTA